MTDRLLPTAGQPGGMSEHDFRSLLECAVNGVTDFIMWHISIEPNLAWRADLNGVTLLYRCSSYGHDETARALLIAGARWEARISIGWTAMMTGAYSGRTEIVEVLLEFGADPDSRTEEHTSLGLACEQDYPDICLILIAGGANAMEICYDGMTALELYGRGRLRGPVACYNKEEKVEQLRAAWLAGPHPTQVRRRNWERRWPFMSVMVGCDFQPLLARQLVLLELNPPLPPDAEIPSIEIATPEQYRAYLHGCIFAHPGFWKIIASYL